MLRQAGMNPVLIWSLSGQSAGLLFLLLSAYLFAVFRGWGRTESSDIEHPLTNSRQYMTLYCLMPFLGGLVSVLCMYDAESIEQLIVSAVLGTMAATFGLWIVVDPLLGLIEALRPASRAHRLARHEIARAEQNAIQKRQEELLAAIEMQEQENIALWNGTMAEQAAELVRLVTQPQATPRIISIGLEAWKLGGLECMQHLCGLASDKDKENKKIALHISTAWDGIGSWRY
jgi:hypothetical protein